VLGVDDDRLVLSFPKDGEFACSVMERAVTSDDCGLVVLDSLAGLVPVSEFKTTYYDHTIATQSQLISRLVKRMTVLLRREKDRGHGVSVLFVNQLRANLGNLYEPEKMPGGFAVRHFCRLIARIGQLARKRNKDGEQVGGLRFSLSFASKISKIHLMHLSGSAEYELEELSGNPLDVPTLLKYAGDVGYLKKVTASTWQFGNKRYTRLKDIESKLLVDPKLRISVGSHVINIAKELQKGGGVIE
jgi:recombination protein RecA